ncbi:unnamed protein product [Rotaria sp. Silwood2]|nr:unnamed protein product [Rotaria sp. Silwood2]
MSLIIKDSIQLQANLCTSSVCNLPSEAICCHCHKQYCHLYFMCHRKYLIDNMQSISEQMSLNHAQLLNSKLSRRIFLPADIILELGRKYAYNMFDKLSSIYKSDCYVIQRKSERFIENYRYYNELINLRQKWIFLQAALTTFYFPAKKGISLDKILTFLEYRHAYNFTYINETSIEKTDETITSSDLIKTDRDHCDDETS